MNILNFSHFLQIWVFPPGIIILLMLIGFYLTLRGRNIGRKISVSAFVIFWFLSSPHGAQFLIDGLQHSYHPLNPAAMTADSQTGIVVLGDGIEDASEYANHATLSNVTLARVHYAAYLHKLTNASIIVSGGNRDYFGHSEASLMQSELQSSYATPVAAIENTSRNTLEQSTLLVPILTANNVRRMYLVTNAWHMRRSMYTFKQAFNHANVTIIPASMGYIELLSKQRTITNSLPSLNALNTSTIAIHEYIGLAWYHIYTMTHNSGKVHV